MKKIILTLAVTAFTLAAFAGPACCDKAKAGKDAAACAGKDKATCAAKDKAACAGKDAAACAKAKGVCPAAAKKVQSPKAAGNS